MPVRLPTFALPAAVLIVLLLFAGIAQAGEAAGTTVVIPSQFPLSGSAEFTCTGAAGGPLAGSVRVIYTNSAEFLHIPAAVENGARLTYLRDQESGAIFRNNTMTLPVYNGQNRAASLVLATENLTGGKEGFTGRITGAELDILGGELIVDGYKFSAGTAIFLQDLPEGISYRISLTEGDRMTEAVNAGLEPAELYAQDVPVAVEISAADRKSADSIEFMIVSMGADAGWAGRYGVTNVTIYERINDTAVPLACRMLEADAGTRVCQAVVAGPGTFILAAAGDRQAGSIGISLSGLADLALFGGLLGLLGSALFLMIRRVVGK